MTRAVGDTPNSEQRLQLGWRLSQPQWAAEVASVLDWLASGSGNLTDSERDAMRQCISEQLPATALPIVILYAYADIPSGTTWDRALRIGDSTSVERTTASLLYGVFWRRLVTNILSAGHTQIAVLDFPDGCPSSIAMLPVDNDECPTWSVVLCDSSTLGDFDDKSA